MNVYIYFIFIYFHRTEPEQRKPDGVCSKSGVVSSNGETSGEPGLQHGDRSSEQGHVGIEPRKNRNRFNL
jgi:hypothetical protein